MVLAFGSGDVDLAVEALFSYHSPLFSFLAIVVGHVLRAIIPLADDVDASRTTALRGRREAVDGLGGPSYVFCKSAIANRER